MAAPWAGDWEQSLIPRHWRTRDILNGKTEKAHGLSDRNLNYSKQGGEMSLQGKVALITGASMEPGSEVAVALARAGAKVAVEGAAGVQERVLRTVETFGGDALPVRGDLLDESDVRHILSNVEAILGPVDILVNASGMTLDKSLEEADVGEWEQAAIGQGQGRIYFQQGHCAWNERARSRPRYFHSVALRGRNGGRRGRAGPWGLHQRTGTGGQRLWRGGISARSRFLDCGGGGRGSSVALRP